MGVFTAVSTRQSGADADPSASASVENKSLSVSVSRAYCTPLCCCLNDLLKLDWRKRPVREKVRRRVVPTATTGREAVGPLRS